ncbi:GroES-like protein [Fomitopsis betulina]|nr:GroES-like protein [Fomitopsis betulina]
MNALIVQPDKTAKVQQVPVPEIDEWEILAKVVAVAQNPTDWKFIENLTNPGTISGCDWSGHVVKLGSKVSGLAIGDHVSGFTHGGTYKDRGAFAKYVKATYNLCWKVPESTLSHEQAAAMNCGYWTAAQCLFHPTRLGLVEPPNKVERDEYVFVYGGSSSVGMYALQLAHIAGYKVVTVASPKNHALCKSFGADLVFDYKDPGAIEKIKEATKNSVHRALDTISTELTHLFALNVFGPGPGKLTVIQPLPLGEKAQQLRPDVEKQTFLLYTTLGREFFVSKHWPVSPEDQAHMARFLVKTPELIATGKVKPNPTKLWEGGLNAIPDGLRYMKEGKNSGEKIVYRIA